eukprot:SAG31_NODE_17338_length_674_cov_1.520000_1_plen_80_part_01
MARKKRKAKRSESLTPMKKIRGVWGGATESNCWPNEPDNPKWPHCWVVELNGTAPLDLYIAASFWWSVPPFFGDPVTGKL